MSRSSDLEPRATYRLYPAEDSGALRGAVRQLLCRACRSLSSNHACGDDVGTRTLAAGGGWFVRAESSQNLEKGVERIISLTEPNGAFDVFSSLPCSERVRRLVCTNAETWRFCKKFSRTIKRA